MIKFNYYTILFLTTINSSFLAFSQNIHLQNLPIDVIVNNKQLLHPFIGGFNNPQFSEADFNNDAILDLFIFDNEGNVSLTFLNNGTIGQVDYAFAPNYSRYFPENITQWAMLRDFDKDGIHDLFVRANESAQVDGMEVYKGYYQNDTIAFKKIYFSNRKYNYLYYTDTDNSLQWLYANPIDYPAIDDLDGDGDLDILTFAQGGGFVEYYQNQSVESGFQQDSLIFSKGDVCWGNFFETGQALEVSLSDTMEQCSNGLKSGVKHGASTLLTLDIDNDQDKDLFFGNLLFDGLNLLINGGDATTAFITEQQAYFPNYDTPISISYLPLPFHLDVNNDGKKDLLIAPYSTNSENYKVVQWYQNTNDNQLPHFTFQQNDFLSNEMIDVGTAAHPAFVDYNVDGLLDVVVGSEGYFIAQGQRSARLLLYENIGTSTQPKLELKDDDWLSFSSFSSESWLFAPTFGDIDQDGDVDLLVGDIHGKLFFGENVAGAVKPLEIKGLTYPYMNIDSTISLGQNAVPQIVDVNEDGLVDLLIGEANGNINYFQNTGTVGSPFFNPDLKQFPNSDFFAGVDTRIPGQAKGYSQANLLKINGQWQLFVGTQHGSLQHYQPDSELWASAELLQENILPLRVGELIKAAFADWNKDGFLDGLIGNARGGLNAFSTNIELAEPLSSQEIFQEKKATFTLFHHHQNHNLHLQTNFSNIFTPKKIRIYNLQGKLLLEKTITHNHLIINTKKWVKGVYFCQLKTGQQQISQPFFLL